MRYTSAKHRPGYTFDAELLLKDEGLVATPAAATVDSSAKIIDLGGEGLFEGDIVIDISAIEIASGDEHYEIIAQVSKSPTFASDVAIACILPVGDGSTLATYFGTAGVTVDDAAGRYVLPFRNERNGTTYRYVRLFTDVTGDIATGINYTAFLALQKGS